MNEITNNKRKHCLLITQKLIFFKQLFFIFLRINYINFESVLLKHFQTTKFYMLLDKETKTKLIKMFFFVFLSYL